MSRRWLHVLCMLTFLAAALVWIEVFQMMSHDRLIQDRCGADAVAC